MFLSSSCVWFFALFPVKVGWLNSNRFVRTFFREISSPLLSSFRDLPRLLLREELLV